MNREASGELKPKPQRKATAEAAQAFLEQCEIEPSSMKKYRRILNRLSDFAQ